VSGNAVQSPFIRSNGEARVRIPLGGMEIFSFLPFVLFFPDEGRWDNNRGRNYSISLRSPAKPLLEVLEEEGRGKIAYRGSDDLGGGEEVAPAEEGPLDDPVLASVSKEIIERETGRNSWTLMHRFNLAFDLLDRAGGKAEGLALLLVWLRFSALRELDWQRNYNTKPRELSHAMSRLVQKVTRLYYFPPTNKTNQGLIRLILGTLGRGGEGQRIRDEILEIMHRRHIKEVSGQFLEEWHQKMHNNTTPDDIGICEAYLEFLRSGGNLERFYRRLQDAGITRERLESFERPLRTPPDFVPSLKDALIHDFEHFLKTLKSVHAGADLETAIEAAAKFLDGDLQNLLSLIWRHRDAAPSSLVPLMEEVTEARRRLQRHGGEDPGGSDLLFLDLALESFLRTVVERSLHLSLTGEQLAKMISLALENWLLIDGQEELFRCFHHWRRLTGEPRFDRDWSLHAAAVAERLGRVESGIIDGIYQLLQPKAEFLGRAFKADRRRIEFFSEEVVRGSFIFVLSVLLRHLLPLLRRAAHLGAWQIISRHSAKGRVETAATLGSIQGRQFSEPRVFVADRVRGDEEIPPQVTAVLTPDSIDTVSHLAIRARNSRVLLAICHDSQILDRLKSLAGRFLSLAVNAAGDVSMEEEAEETPSRPTPSPSRLGKITPVFSETYAVPSGDFRKEIVGGKSLNLKRLKGMLPDWIHLPVSVALPFGVFEAVLREKRNRRAGEEYAEMVSLVDRRPDEILPGLRKTILALDPPEDLLSSLRRVLEGSNLKWPEESGKVWMSIKRVWASKWNERAYWSRKARGIRHEELYMAVLIQEVVEAEYAFVIHTVNPVSGKEGEIYAEMVLGMGETLVGNYPGRALSFIYPKESRVPRLETYPSKSVGIYGSGLIFRSDSNGEDLQAYAGAGLYDSVLLQPPERLLLDYTEEPLVWEDGYRRDLMNRIGEVGLAVEKVMGSPQDVEGALAKGRWHVVQTRAQVGIEND
jgi:alpha-glucan,water dikinase